MLRSRQLHRISLCLFVTVALLGFGTVFPHSSGAGTNGRLELDKVSVHPTGSWRFSSGLRWETGRSLTSKSTTDYTNIRFKPLEMSYALTNRLQFGSRIAYSSNSADQGSFPAEAGIEGLDLISKFRWNRNLATVFTVGRGFSEDVFPYGGDGVDVGLNFPTQFSLGPGTAMGELGFTVKSGQAKLPGARPEWDNYFNYGLGYFYELTDDLRMTAEILGHGATVDTSNSKSFMEFILTPEMILSKSSSVSPSLSLGLNEGSPNFGFGLKFRYKIGGLESRRVPIDEEDIGSENFGSLTSQPEPSKETPAQADERRRKEPLVLPGELKPETESDTEGKEEAITDTPERNPERAQELANRGRQTFEEDGNLSRAIDYLKRAVKHDPENVEILSNLGSLLYRKKRYEEAVKYYQRAIDADPQDQFSHLFLGITYHKLEQLEKARNHLKKAQSINPNNSTAQRAEEWLDRIEDNE